ncbi:uncharacterized protein [Temnothorax nylanderi]|uniref:uncharacterized protein isoform X2 n=1 Tax=Temnothorax nylanderi TaxID=102681 RepID=UPI003A8AF946
MDEKLKVRGTIEIDREAMEKMLEGRATKMMKNFKEELKELREEVENLRRKVYKMEQVAGKRKRDGSEEREEKSYRRKWWSEDNEKDDVEERRKNIIIRVEKDRWGGNCSNWKKMKQLFAEGLRVKVELKEVVMLGLRGDWLTLLVKLGSEEDKWSILEARRREGSRMKIKMDEDKSIEERIKKGREREKRREMREEENENKREATEEDIAKKLEDNLIMKSDEDEDEAEKGEGQGKRLW